MDRTRATYHFQPEKNWMNDPNGPAVLEGKLHMFYQYNPFGASWGNMTWGHAVAENLVRWKRLEPALRPDAPYDKDGVFSGCCVVREGIPHLLYTGVQPEVQCLAIGDAHGEHFQKVRGQSHHRAPAGGDAHGLSRPLCLGGGRKDPTSSSAAASRTSAALPSSTGART